MDTTKQIATLPPLEELQGGVPLSRRTGEPRRPVVLALASVLLYLAVASAVGAYAWHWWMAAHPASYANSAWLIAWTDPAPGTWLSLTLEVALAAALALAAGAAGIAGFQAWNGWRWARWAGLVAAALMGGFMAITHWYAAVPVGLTALGAGLLFLPPVTRYFRHWTQVRATRPAPYRRPGEIHYGRLARFR